jgi:hypothetical protein
MQAFLRVLRLCPPRPRPFFCASLRMLHLRARRHTSRLHDTLPDVGGLPLLPFGAMMVKCQ